MGDVTDISRIGKTSACMLKHSGEFAWSVVSRLWTWAGVPITIWGLLPPEKQQSLTGNYWPSSIDNKWVMLLGFSLIAVACYRAFAEKAELAEGGPAHFDICINRIEPLAEPVPYVCRVRIHLKLRNRGGTSLAKQWYAQTTGAQANYGGRAVNVNFAGRDLIDSPLGHNKSRIGFIDFEIQGLQQEQALSIPKEQWVVGCQDGQSQLFSSNQPI